MIISKKQNLAKCKKLNYTKNVGKEQQTATWVFMILTALRKHFDLQQADFLSIIKKHNLVHFLMEQYELLHYYDNDYIINDIKRYIEEQGGNIDEIERNARNSA